MKNKIMELKDIKTFWEDVRHIVGYYDENVFLEDWVIKDLQRVADYRYSQLEQQFIDKQYNIMKNWVFNVNEKELEEHYKYYNVKIGDKEDLLNIMFESYCNNYNNEELEERIKYFEEV